MNVTLTPARVELAINALLPDTTEITLGPRQYRELLMSAIPRTRYDYKYEPGERSFVIFGIPVTMNPKLDGFVLRNDEHAVAVSLA